jgi:hypothetical protein
MLSLALTNLPPMTFAGGPGGQDVTKPYFYRPAPERMNETDLLRLKNYRDQLYWQQQSLQIKQSTTPLTPIQQQRLNQIRLESARVNTLLKPSLGQPLPSPPVQTTIGPLPLIPAR